MSDDAPVNPRVKTVHECFDQARVMTKPGTQEFRDLYRHLLVKNGHLVPKGTPGASANLPCGWPHRG